MSSAVVPSSVDKSTASIEESVVQLEKYPTVTERYFTARYALDPCGQKGEDHCILFHTNRICMVTLAPSHPILALKKTISRIDFQVLPNVNRLENKVSGKGKHGAQVLTESAPLCKVVCTDNSAYTTYSCIRGKLVEMNENLVSQPNLLAEKPMAEGYIAIVLPKLGESEKQREKLLTQAQYQEKMDAKSP